MRAGKTLMGRQCNTNSFRAGKRLSVWFVYYCTDSRLFNQRWNWEPKSQKCKIASFQKIQLFSLKVFVWLLSGIAGTCAGLTGNGKLPAAAFWLEKLQSAVLKQCCEVMGHAVKEGYQSCKERVPRALCVQRIGTRFAQAGSFVCNWKESKSLQESQWAAFGLMQVLWETCILSFTLGNEVDILAVTTVVRGTFSSLPVRSGIPWEGSCLVSFWISCETN